MVLNSLSTFFIRVFSDQIVCVPVHSSGVGELTSGNCCFVGCILAELLKRNHSAFKSLVL